MSKRSVALATDPAFTIDHLLCLLIPSFSSPHYPYTLLSPLYPPQSSIFPLPISLSLCNDSIERSQLKPSSPDMTSLKTLLALQPKVLYPAHGPHIPGVEACRDHIQTYITHRQAREQQIIGILTKAASDPKSTLHVLQTLLEGYEDKKSQEWKYKQQFLGRLKPEPAPTPENLEKKAKEEDKREEKKKEQEVKLDVNKKDGGGISALSLDILIRLIYKTPDEKVLFAAKKGTLAHLVKLMKEGKVVRRGVLNPVILDGEVKEPAEVEGWEWAEEV